MRPSPEEIKLRKLALLGDELAKKEATRLARRRGEEFVICLGPDGQAIEVLDPDEEFCRPAFGDPPCGGCDSCLYRQSVFYGAVMLDCREAPQEINYAPGQTMSPGDQEKLLNELLGEEN